jgi:hypothetical protein
MRRARTVPVKNDSELGDDRSGAALLVRTAEMLLSMIKRFPNDRPRLRKEELGVIG